MTAATKTPTPNSVPKADGQGLLDPAWLEGAASLYRAILADRVACVHNATTAVATLDTAAYGSLHIEYCFRRGTAQRAGRISVCGDGTSPTVVDTASSNVGSPGLTWTVTVASGVVSLNAVVDNSVGTDGVLIFHGKKLVLPA